MSSTISLDEAERQTYTSRCSLEKVFVTIQGFFDDSTAETAESEPRLVSGGSDNALKGVRVRRRYPGLPATGGRIGEALSLWVAKSAGHVIAHNALSVTWFMLVIKQMSSTPPLRPEEEFVMNQLVGKYGGSWQPGANPPDAILMLGKLAISVEITTLMQPIPDAKKGGTRSRYSDEASALRMIDALKVALKDQVPESRTVILTLRAPIDDVRTTTTQLQAVLAGYLASGNDVEAVEEICGNEINVRIVAYQGRDDEKIHGVVAHRNSSPDILRNALSTLADRVAVKAAKCQSLTGPVWLALLNDYWLADAGTYRQALEMHAPAHPFEKILLVMGNGAVTELCAL